MFITFEGIEGVGKTTHIRTVAGYLEARGISVVVTREPGGTALGDEVREILLKPRTPEPLLPMTELLLLFAVRTQHLNCVVLPALAQGKWVLCDRFTEASYAYQGGGRGMSMETIQQLETMVQGNLRPDWVVLLDAPVAIGLARAQKRGTCDRFEQETYDFFEKVRAVYLMRAKQQVGRYQIIDASGTMQMVEAELLNWCNTL
jgi:dTMP kinase